MLSLCPKIVIAVLLLTLNLALADDGTIVMTKYGPVQGDLLDGSYRRWQGVPFASPPLGELRWKNPVPPGSWDSPLDCRNFTIACAQLAHGLDVPYNKSEDCLYLEVYAPPKGRYTEPASVMVFFYGGAFKEGGESFLMYDGAWMSSTTNTILVVTNYRLGVFGFLYTPEVDANLGLSDQRFTLSWVHENIAAFGGNPDQVTIFGESAGGQSVLIHLSSPEQEVAKYFHGAIVESGPFSAVYRSAHDGLIQSESFGGYLGCPKLTKGCLDSKSTEDVLHAAQKTLFPILGWTQAIMRWAPVVDGKTFVRQVQEAFETGQIVKVPMMMGENKNDAMLFAQPLSQKGFLPEWEYRLIILGIFHDKWVSTVLDAYPVQPGQNAVDVLSEMLTDYFFTCGARRALRLAEAAGVSELYHYQLTQEPQPCFWPKSQAFCCDVVCHGDELPFVFKPTAIHFNATVALLQDAVSSYWTSFGASGNPNKGAISGNIHWPLYSNTTGLNINLGWPLSTSSFLRQKHCDMFDEIGYMH